MDYSNLGLAPAFLIMLAWFYTITCWFYNVYLLFKCDFDAPFKDEIIHLIGVVIPPLSGITVWL